MTIFAYTDGASRGNPGEGGIGIVLKNEQGSTIASHFGYIGKATNNAAEYLALVECLKLTKKTDCKNLIVHSDSELLVRQLNGKYKVKNNGMKKYYHLVQKLLSTSQFRFEIKYVPRDENREADQLANLGINTKKRLRV